jgi:chemotaxis protein CheX
LSSVELGPTVTAVLTFDNLDPVIRECCADLCAHLLGDQAAETDPDPAGEREIVSFIELGGPALRATMASRARSGVVRASHPRRRKQVTEQEILDWAAEILNQIAGRITNKLGARGVDVEIGIPGSLIADELQLFCEGAARERQALVFEGYGIRVYLNVGAAPRDLAVLDSGQAAACANEGDVLLF